MVLKIVFEQVLGGYFVGCLTSTFCVVTQYWGRQKKICAEYVTNFSAARVHYLAMVDRSLDLSRYVTDCHIRSFHFS